MKLLDLVNRYVTFKRSLGMRFATQPRVLRRFARVLGNIELGDVTPEAVEAFLYGDRTLTNTCFLNHRLLHGLYRFAISRGFVSCSPLPDITPVPLPPFRPHIYSTSEITGLLDATSVLKSCRNPKQPFTFRVLLLVLYSTGIRVGEALRLVLQDVDLQGRVLTIRDTKFFKSRLVPVGPQLTRELAAFSKMPQHSSDAAAGAVRILCIQHRPRHTVSARHHSIPACSECSGHSARQGI